MKRWICPHCETDCMTKDAYYRHLHETHPEHKFKCDSIKDKRWDGKTWVCQYCNEPFKSRRRLHDHYKNCKIKLSLPVNALGRVYLPEYHEKAIASRKAHFADGLIIRKPCSLETRRKLSIARRKHIANGTGSSTWVNPHIHRSYAEQYFYDILSNELGTSVDWKNNYRVCGYLLDFANLSNKVYFEVDGETHYTADGIAYDAKRTAELADNGWFLIGRIRWKLYRKMNDEERKKIVESYLDAFTSDTTNPIPPIQVNDVSSAILKKHKTIPRDAVKRQKDIEAYCNKHKIAEQNGLLRADGHINGKGVPTMEWARRKDLILNSGVDLLKFGWVGKVEKATHLTKRVIEATIRRFPDVFEGRYFRRK